jgi:hypothetical protein
MPIQSLQGKRVLVTRSSPDGFAAERLVADQQDGESDFFKTRPRFWMTIA